MIRVVDPAGGPEAVAAGGAGRVTGAVVPRPVLLGRVGGPARVTVVSASAGSGKTVLLRSWLGQAGLVRAVSAAPDLDGWGAGRAAAGGPGAAGGPAVAGHR